MKDETASNSKKNSEKVNNYNRINSSTGIRDTNLFSKDFLFFKNDILKDIKDLEIKLENQKKVNAELKNIISSHDLQLIKLNNKIENISNNINQNKVEADFYKEKLDILLEFKTKTEDELASHDCKLKINAEEIRNAINKYDRVIYESLELPGIVGKDGKFRSFRNLLDYVLNQLKALSIFKDKNNSELQSYRTKLDSTVNSLNYQIASIMGNANTFTTSNIKELEKKCMNEIKSYDDKIMKLRVNNLELIQNFEKEKNQIFEEWNNIKNMKKELVELVDSSIKKMNTSNNHMKKTLDNYEKQFNEIKNDISSITEIYNKMKKENLENFNHNNISKSNIIYNSNFQRNNNEEKKDLSINKTKSDFFKSNYLLNESHVGTKRIQSAKSDLQDYIEGNSFYQRLKEKNNSRCKQHENSESTIKFMMKKYYDEGIGNKKNLSIYGSLENLMNKNNQHVKDKNKANQTMNSSPKNFNLNDNECKKVEHSSNTNMNYSKNKKFILVKEGEVINNNHNRKNKNKSKETERRLIIDDKFTESFIDKRKITNLKQLSSISFLYDDIKNKKFPNIDKIEISKNDDIVIKAKKIHRMNKNTMDSLKYKEYDVASGINLPNDNKPKTHKIGRKMSSPEAIQYHNNNGSEQNISLNKAMINNIYYENSSGKNKRDEKSKIKRKISDSIKKTIYRLKSEKNK